MKNDGYEYSVLEEGEVVAQRMTLNNAMTLVRALFNEDFDDRFKAITIQREDNHCVMVDVDERTENVPSDVF